jgi:hypothetical protein
MNYMIENYYCNDIIIVMKVVILFTGYSYVHNVYA